MNRRIDAAGITVADQYQAISEEEQAKAKTFFERGREVANTGNFDYAIEMFLQGLTIDPENVEAHTELREIALKRKASGGKGLGMMDRLKSKATGKDEKQNMLQAEKNLAMDPGDTGFMEALLTSAHKAGFFDTVMWIGPILQKANAEAKKPEFNKFIVLKDVYKRLAMDNSTPPRVRPELFKRATVACQLAAQLKPDEMELSTELKNLGALHTQVEGKYDQGGSFRDSIKDRETQEKLQAQDKDVHELGVMGKLINDAEAQYQLDPTEPGKLLKLVDVLEKTEHPDYESRAIELLDEWHKKTKQFRFRKRVGEIQMRQWRRMEQSQREYLLAHKDDEQAKKDFEQFLHDRWEFELAEFNLWAENYPTDMTFRYQAARRLFELKRYEESIPLFQAAEQDAKYRTQARLYQGRAFFGLEFYDEAVDTLDNLVKEYVNEDDAAKEMRYWAARAHEARGDNEVAIKLYSAIVRMEFNYKDVQLRIRKLRAAAGGNAPQK
jgi:tetratricopeptide (TPR) repeat protein